jgi:hypothetical protein
MGMGKYCVKKWLSVSLLFITGQQLQSHQASGWWIQILIIERAHKAHLQSRWEVLVYDPT